MKPKALILFLFLPLLLPGCDRYKDSPRPGEPFFCKINGKVFRPRDDNSPVGGVGANPVKLFWDKEDGWFYISATNSPQTVSIFIKLDSGAAYLTQGTYYFSTDMIDSSFGSYYYNYLTEPNNHRERLISSRGSVNISKAEGGFVSGTFEFTCISPKTGKEYRITEGCFNDL